MTRQPLALEGNALEGMALGKVTTVAKPSSRNPVNPRSVPGCNKPGTLM